MDDRQPSVSHSGFAHIPHPHYFSISLLSALSIEVPILHLPLPHGVVFTLHIHFILHSIQRRVTLLLVILLKKDQFRLVEEEALLFEEYSLHILTLDIMDASDIIRQQLPLRLLHGLFPGLLLNLRKAAIIHIPLSVVLLGRDELLRLVDLYVISLIAVYQLILIGR
jgi:hypothetical protein